jgi:hypothetical protein
LLAIAGAGLMQEFGGAPPDHFCLWWTQDLWCLHSVAWWRRHWERTGIMEIERADTMPDGWQHWLTWHEVVAPGNETEIAALKADRGRYLGYVRVVARRHVEATLADHIESVPAQYTRMPLLRSEES